MTSIEKRATISSYEQELYRRNQRIKWQAKCRASREHRTSQSILLSLEGPPKEHLRVLEHWRPSHAKEGCPQDQSSSLIEELPKGGDESLPHFYMTKLEMLTKSTDFYIAESVRLLAEDEECKTAKEKKAIHEKLVSLKSKIIFEIEEVNKTIEEAGGSDNDNGDDWKEI